MINKELTQEILVLTQDRVKFIDTVLQLGKLGAVRKEGTVPRFGAPFGFRTEMVLKIDSLQQAVKSSPGVHALPPAYFAYPEAELKVMDWDDFREACTLHGVKGKERAKMIEDYLVKTNQKY